MVNYEKKANQREQMRKIRWNKGVILWQVSRKKEISQRRLDNIER